MTISSLTADPASFRDPAGQVYESGDKIYRIISNTGAADFKEVWDSGILSELAEQKHMIDAILLPSSHPLYEQAGNDTAYILEHPRLALISYPYEWSFHALKAAALAHLSLHLTILDKDFTLSDASAFNMQFVGTHPVHIDTLSVIPYHEGEAWTGYKQFLQHFLNPLIFESITGISHSTWWRGSMDGMTSEHLSRLLPWYTRLFPSYMMHVFMPAKGERRYTGAEQSTQASKPPALSKTRYKAILQHLHNVISSLSPAKAQASRWGNYSSSLSYSDNDAQIKRSIIEEYLGSNNINTLLDVGCNKGEYAQLAVEKKVQHVIGIDVDHLSVDKCFLAAQTKNLPFTPIVSNLCNPSPAQGWNYAERKTLHNRINADAIIALAVIHHMCITNNIPLNQAIAFLVSLAPKGIIEFVPITDPMVKELLQFRKITFPEYTLENAREYITQKATITGEYQVGDSERHMIAYAAK